MSDDHTFHRKFLPWIIALAILAAGFAVFVLWRPEAEGQAETAPTVPLVETADIVAVDDALSVTQTGFVGPVDSVPVVAEIGGRVVSINPDFAVGATVSEGDVLFEISDDVYQADVARAQAQVNQANASLTEAADTLSRQSELEQSNFASEAALQGARTAQAQAEGNLELAEAQLRTARIALDDTTVEAPFDAVVTEKSLSPGQFVQPGVSIGHIAVSEAVEVRVGLSENQFTTVTKGGPLVGRTVQITPRRLGPVVADMQARDGRVVSVSPVLDPQSRTVEVVVHVPRQTDNHPALQFNQLVTAGFALPATDDPLLRAPRQALQRGQTIWAVTDQSQLARLEASIIRQTDNWVYFTVAAAPGTRVLLTVLDAPVDGMAVRLASQEENTQLVDAAQ